MDSVIQFEGTIYEDGYGLLAQKVMRDKSLPKQSKLIYAYMCSFAGVGKNGERTAFPSISLQCFELGMTEETYYKWRKPLLTKGYLKITKQRQEGAKFDNNLYSILAVPVPAKEIKETSEKEQNEPYPKKQGTDEPYPNFPSTEKPCTEKQGTNINSLNSNSLNNKKEEEEEFSKLNHLFSSLITKSNSLIAEELKKWLLILPFDVIKAQIEYCSIMGAKTWVYVESSLKENEKLNIKTLQELEAKFANHKNRNNKIEYIKNKSSRKVVRRELLPDWYHGEDNKKTVVDSSDLDKKAQDLAERLKKYGN